MVLWLGRADHRRWGELFVSVRLLRKPIPETAFVFGGGGNLGVVQVGMLQALFEAGVTPDVVIGCSVGALNAAGLAADPSVAGVRRMRETWLSLDGDELFPAGRITGLWMLGRKGQAIQANTGLRNLIERTLPYERLEDAPLPVHVNATSLQTGRGRWFTSGSAADAILASAALPAVFPPVVVGGEAYIDGGVVDNVPISRALALGARRIFVLHVGNFTRPRQLPKRPIDVLLQSFSIARNHRFLAETDDPPPDVEFVVLPGVDPGRIRRNDFSKSRELMERAYVAARDFLSEGVAVSQA
jgi:NTE family protein